MEIEEAIQEALSQLCEEREHVFLRDIVEATQLPVQEVQSVLDCLEEDGVIQRDQWSGNISLMS